MKIATLPPDRRPRGQDRRHGPLRRVIWPGLCLLLGGCTVGPNYKEPRIEVPASFATTQPASADLAHWWKEFNDPQLDGLIDQAVRNNLDLQLAEARVREARAQRQFVEAGLFPEVDTSGSYERVQISKSAGIAGFAPGAPASGTGNASGAGGVASGGAGGGTLGSGNGTGIAAPQIQRPGQKATGTGTGSSAAAGSSAGAFAFPERFTLWRSGFDASWEIDVFGAQRRSIEAATYDIQALQESRRDTLVSLLGEVASNYVQVRGLQREIQIAEQNIRAQQETVNLTRSRFKAGLATDLDVARAQAQVESTRSTVPRFRTSLRQSIHRLGVLLGHEPESLIADLSVEKPIPVGPEGLPVGLPSELLRRRPDVRRAERQLAGATARVGMAVADLFPRFSLTGSLGLESQKFKSIANSNSVFWNFGPSVSWPIFDAGKLWANVKVENAREQQAMIQYRQAVLTALEDVENALVGYTQEQQRRQSLQAAVAANQRAVALAEQLYTKGLADFLNVLDAQRDLFAAQDQLTQSERAVSADLVALYKALGGGWEQADLIAQNDKRADPLPQATVPAPSVRPVEAH